MGEELLFKYICGSADEKERLIVLEWIEASDENASQYAKMKNSFALAMFKMQSEQEAMMTPKRKRTPILRYLQTGLSVAAILAVAFFAILQLSSNNDVGKNTTTQIAEVIPTFEYNVNPGVKGKMTLPDGSIVVLNSSSRLVYPQQFDKNSREVYLDGEGWFEVVTNKESPMYIKTSKGYTVKVTGTSFNLSSYANDSDLVATLVEGKISLSGEHIVDEISMSPMEEVTISNENVSYKKSIDPTFATYWKEGVLAFDDTEMATVINKIERWYGVKISVKDSSILKKRFTAKFKSESINQVLNILRISSGIKYTIKDNVVVLSLN